MALLSGLGNWFKEQLQHAAVSSATPDLAAGQAPTAQQIPQTNESPNIQGSINYGVTGNPQAIPGSYFYNVQPQRDPGILIQGAMQYNFPRLVSTYNWDNRPYGQRGPQLMAHLPQYTSVDVQPVTRIR